MSSTDKPVLSIGMPAYNSEGDIADAIDALLAQTFTDFELIISDNCSSDRTQEICEEYSRKDPRVKYHRNSENLGASGNYNRVFELSEGKYFKWASSNDYCAPSFLEKCVQVMDDHPDCVLVCPKTRLYSKEITNCSDYHEPLSTLGLESPTDRMAYIIDNIRLNNVMNGVFRSEHLAKTPLMVPFFASDVCLMGEIALYGHVLEIDEFLFYRQMDEESSTSMQDTETLTEHYYPAGGKKMYFQYWKGFLFYFDALKRCGLQGEEKRRAQKAILKRMYWYKDKLARDVMFWKPYRAKKITNWKEL